MESRGSRTKPIGEVRIFDRTESRNPLRAEVDPSLPDPKTWKVIHFRLPKKEGGEIDFELARSPEWIAATNSEPGASVLLSMPELGVEGWAEVVSVSPCPEPAPGDGPLVTGIFRHRVDWILDIEIGGQAKIGTTPNHLWWSDDRQEFVPADSLQDGEQVQTRLQGSCRIMGITLRPAPQMVYNLEVWGEHVYRVGKQGALVHNTYPHGRGLPGVQSAADSMMHASGGPRFGSNFAKKVRKHINQVRHRQPGVVDNIPSPGLGGIGQVESIIRNRVAQGGGELTTYAGQSAIRYIDDGMTYIFRQNGEFWTILGN
jgi:hypothetical protein